MANAGNIDDLPEIDVLEQGSAADLPEIQELETGTPGFFLPSDERTPGVNVSEPVPPSTSKRKRIDPALLAGVTEPQELAEKKKAKAAAEPAPEPEPPKGLKLTTEDYWEHLVRKQHPEAARSTDFDYGNAQMSGETTVSQGWIPPKPVPPEVLAEFEPIAKFRQEQLEGLQDDATRVAEGYSGEDMAVAEEFLKNRTLTERFGGPGLQDISTAPEQFITATPAILFGGTEEEKQEYLKARQESIETAAEWPLSWATVKAINRGTEGFLRTLDNAAETVADITGMEKGGEFGMMADYISDNQQVLPELPDTPIGNAFSDALTISTQLGLELFITPTLKYAKAAQMAPGVFSGTIPKILNNLGKVGLGSAESTKKLFTYTSPKFATQMGTSNFLNTYGELTKQGEDDFAKSMAAFRAMGYGAFEGSMFTMLGYGSKIGAGYVQRATKMGPLSWSAGVGINSVGFGSFTAVEQLITSGEIDWDKVRHSTLTGFGLGVVGLPKEIFGKAFGNYSMASPLATKKAIELKRSPEDLRDQSFDLRRKAEAEPDQETAEGLRAEADAIDNITDIKVIHQDVLNNPRGYVTAIEMDAKMSRGEKDFHINKINETVLENDPKVQEATPISNEIDRIQEKIDAVAENTALDNNIKVAQVAELKSKLLTKQAELSEVFSEKPPAKPKPVEGKEEPPVEKEKPPTEEELETEFKQREEAGELAEERPVSELTQQEQAALEAARSEPEFTTKDGKYIITKTPQGLDVFNVQNQKSVKAGSTQGKAALEEYKESVIERLKRGKRAEGVEQIEDELEANRLIAETSENPQEIAETYLRATQVRPEDMTLNDAISETLAGTRVTAEAFSRAGDPNFITPAIRLNYFNKEGIKSFDALVESIKETGEGQFDRLDPIEMEQNIVDFITQNPGGSKQYEAAKRADPLVQELQEKFRKLAGFELTPEYAKKLTTLTEFEKLSPEEQIEFANLEFSKLQNPPIDAEIERFSNRSESEVSESQSVVDGIASKGENAERLSEQELRDGIEEATEFIEGGGKKPPKEPPVEGEPLPEGEGPEGVPVFVDKNVSFITDLGAKIKKGLKKFFTPAGLLPKKVFKEKVKMDSRTSAMLNEIEFTAKRFRKGVNEAYGKVTPEQLAEIDGVLKGEADVSTLPESLQEPIQSMRNQIDALSQRFIDEGLIGGDLVGKIQENLGTYLTRSYEVHDNPKWKDTVPAEIKNRAVAFIRSKYPDLTAKELEGQINELLDAPDAPLSIIASGKLGAKDLSILKARKDIAPEIRALLGEYSDPLLNYARSITKMSNLISKSKFLKEVEEAGMNDFLFDKPTGEYHRVIAAEGSKTMEPLNGLYTTPEIAEAFEAMGEQVNLPAYLRNYMKINGLVKYSKTILSAMTHVRNLVGNTGFAVANGHWRAGEMAPAIKTTISQLGKMENPEFKEAYRKYQELGVVGESARGGELQDIIKDASKEGGDLESMMDNTATKFLKKGRKVVNDMYQAEDDVWKIYAFENEMARYKKAYPEMEQGELDQKVADIVRNTYPTYSLVPEAIKQLRRVPLVGTFVSFPAEVVRTAYNTVELAVKELKDPKTRNIGKERLTGIMAAATLTGGAAIATANMYGVTDEEDEAIRRYLPPWSKNSILLSMSGVENGEYTYIDLGYSDPHTYLKAPIMAMMKGDDPVESGIEAMGEFFEPFLGEELLAARMLDISRNTTVDGKKIYNKQDPIGDQMADITIHIAEALEPGTSSSFRRIWKGINGDISVGGKKYDPVNEIIALFSGQRATTTNIKGGFGFKAYRFGQDMADARQIYNKAFFSKKEVSDEELETEYNKANNASEKLFNEMVKDYQAAILLGVSTDDLFNAMKKNGFSTKLRTSIYSGVYTPIKKKGEKAKGFEKQGVGGIVGKDGGGIEPVTPGGIVK